MRSAKPTMGAQPGRERLRRWDPDRIGPFVVLGRLGAGSMGQVYLGRSAAGRLVAVKTIKVELAEEAGFRNRFAQEVAAARRVSGVFTAAVVEADPEADLPWLATAYIPAPSLSRLVQACGPLPVPAVRWLAAGCAEALQSIHTAGLVHRDLKPSNVLIAPDGPKVIDFGVARAAERIELTSARGAVGTPAYMAPEQARDTRQVSVASDVYSLGATLAYAATGHPPYTGDTAMDVLARLATEPPDLSGLPDELGELIGECLERVPRMRPSSSAMLARLGPFTEVQAGQQHSYLPAAAMTLIGEYQRNPLLANGQVDPLGPLGPTDPHGLPAPRGAEHSQDATSASYTELPASHRPRSRRRPSGAGQARAPGPAGWWQWARTHMVWVGWASVGAALVVGGVILGAALSSNGSPALPGLPALPPPPATVCDPSHQASSGPALCMVNVSQGTAATAFVIQGSGFAPRALVTFRLTEVGPPPEQKNLLSLTSPDHVRVGVDGMFRVPVSQLYPGALQLGLVTVDASAPGGLPASTQFMIIPSGPGGPAPSG
jgi:serine/threonine protein kinase